MFEFAESDLYDKIHRNEAMLISKVKELGGQIYASLKERKIKKDNFGVSQQMVVKNGHPVKSRTSTSTLGYFTLDSRIFQPLDLDKNVSEGRKIVKFQ